MRWPAGIAPPRVPVRAIGAVPGALRAALAAALLLQLAWHGLVERGAGAPPTARPLPTPPPAPVLRVAALGEPVALARAGILWLQFHDRRAGVSVPYREMDYGRVRAWLERWLALAPASDYPLTLALRLYGQVADPARQRQMIAFVRAVYPQRPRERWRWLAEAALLAKHRLDDLELALACARELVEHAPAGSLPAWARELRAFILADMGEIDAARALIEGLLASGGITDPAEIAFLERWSKALERGERPLRPGDEPGAGLDAGPD